MYKYYGAPALAVWEGSSGPPTPLNYADVPYQAPQPETCEVCKIYCTNPGGRRTHESGKKHKRNLKKLQESITSEPAKPPNGAVGTSTEPAAAAVADSKIPAVQPKKNRQVLEAGAAQGELKTCTMSNVVTKQLVTCEDCKMQFNSLSVLRDHETGRKHKNKLKKLQGLITSEQAKPPNDAVGASTETAVAAVADGVIPAVQPKKNKSSAASPEDLEVNIRRVLEAGAAQGELKTCTMSNVVTKQLVTCEDCKMQFNSLSVLRDHETGRKHKNKLKKLQGLITSEQANPPNDAVGASTETAVAAVADGLIPAVQPKKNKSSAASPEDLEVNIRRVLEAGSAEGELKTCTMSNVVKKQPVICEVCMIVCGFDLDNLREHEAGKKHKNNLKKLENSITPEPAKPPNDAVGASTEPAAAAVSDGLVPAVQPKKNKSSAASPEDLEVNIRRLLEAGSAQGELKTCTMSNVVKKQPVTCEVCKIVCGFDLDNLREHEAGKKHKNNLKKLENSITPESAKPPNDAVGASTEPAAAAVSDGVVPAVQPEKKKRPAETPEDLEVKRRRVLQHGAAQGELKTCTMSNVVKKQPVICEVCKIVCGINLDNLREHEAGKQHKKNLKKLENSITPEPAKPPNDAVGASTEPPAAAVSDGVVPAVQPEKKKRPAETPEDLEVKRRRVLEHGAAQGELKTCTMSNVVKKQPVTCEVCKIVCGFDLDNLREHEAGKKHKNNLKKLENSITPESAKPPNDAVGASTEPAAAAVSDGVVPAVQPEKKKRPAETPENLEVKRRRVLEHGSAEGEDYELHIAGNGHQANLQQQLLLVA